MAFVPVPGTAKLELEFINNGQEGVNVLHMAETGEVSTALMSSMLTAFVTNYITDILPDKSGAFHLSRLTVTDLTTETGPQATALYSDAGGGVGAGAPTERSIIVQLITGLRGRSYRGRVFDTGYADTTFSVDGNVATGSIGTAQGNWETFRGHLEDLSFPLQVVSYQHDKELTNPGVASTVESIAIATHCGIQRRRLAGR